MFLNLCNQMVQNADYIDKNGLHKYTALRPKTGSARSQAEISLPEAYSIGYTAPA